MKCAEAFMCWCTSLATLALSCKIRMGHNPYAKEALRDGIAQQGIEKL